MHCAILKKSLFRVVRYEDLVSDLGKSIPEFLAFFKLPMQASVKNFIYENTSPIVLKGSSRKGDFGRNPLEAMNKWKHITLYRQVMKVQNECSEALTLWRYKLVATEMDLPDFDFVLDFSE